MLERSCRANTREKVAAAIMQAAACIMCQLVPRLGALQPGAIHNRLLGPGSGVTSHHSMYSMRTCVALRRTWRGLRRELQQPQHPRYKVALD